MHCLSSWLGEFMAWCREEDPEASAIAKEHDGGTPGFGGVAHAHVNPPGLTDVVPWSSSANNIASASFFRPHVMSFAWQKDLTSFGCVAVAVTACAHLQEKIQTLKAKVESLMLAQYIS